jgi:hypothetical protein
MSSFALLCIGTICIGLGLFQFLWNLFFVLRSEEADGTIVGGTDIDEHNSGSNPIVQFKTREGQMIEFKDSSFFGFFLSLISDFFTAYVLKRDPSKVRVAYDPRNPRRARIKNFLYLYHWSLFFFGLGAVIALLSLFPMGTVDKILNFLERLPF